MADMDSAIKRLETREKIARDQVERAAARISETVRYTALGQIGAAYTLIVSNTPFSTGMMREHSVLVFFVLAFGCCALIFELLQYFVTFLHGVRLAQHVELDASNVGGHGIAWTIFWTKCVIAFGGMILLAWVFISSVYFSSRQTAADFRSKDMTVSAAGSTGCAKQRVTN